MPLQSKGNDRTRKFSASGAAESRSPREERVPPEIGFRDAEKFVLKSFPIPAYAHDGIHTGEGDRSTKLEFMVAEDAVLNPRSDTDDEYFREIARAAEGAVLHAEADSKARTATVSQVRKNAKWYYEVKARRAGA
jgi:hypothetical protein